MSGTIYEKGRIAQIATTLFHGWGYNFYRKENQLRADDLMIRARVCQILGDTRALVETEEAAFRRTFLPPPSRERPRPDPEALRGAQVLEGIGSALGAVEGHIRSLPVPESDLMTQRFRREKDTLARLTEADEAMTGHAEFLRALLAPNSGSWMIENQAEIRGCINAIRSAVLARGDVLNP